MCITLGKDTEETAAAVQLVLWENATAQLWVSFQQEKRCHSTSGHSSDCRKRNAAGICSTRAVLDSGSSVGRCVVSLSRLLFLLFFDM